MFDKLFSPIDIGPVTIKNRVAMPALGLLYTRDGHCNDRLIEFYKARAKGGCGLIIVGGVGVDAVGSGVATTSLRSDEFIPGWTRMAETLHKHGASFFVQLFHAGRYHESTGATDKAIEMYVRAGELDPSFADVELGMARIALKKRNRKKAKSHLLRYLELAPQGDDAQWVRDQLKRL